jgi:hypothetical protein
MNILKIAVIIVLITIITACSNEDWTCKIIDKTMLSMSSSGAIGSADKGCSCEEVRSFELRIYGEVDESALKNDFGC